VADVAQLDTASKPGPLLPPALLADLERRQAGLARHMARAVMALVSWDASTGSPPDRSAIARACEAGLDLFLETARTGRPPTHAEMRRVAQLGLLQARTSRSVEPVLAAYRIAARVAWEEILRSWRNHPDGATPEALLAIANYVFTALDQVAAQVTHAYLTSREQHLQRGTRARARLFHALISDTFDSDLALQKQALALSVPLAAGYAAAVCRLVTGRVEGERGGEALSEALQRLENPDHLLYHAVDPQTLVILAPTRPTGVTDAAGDLVEVLRRIDREIASRPGRPRVRAGIGGAHTGLHGASRSYLEAQQALEIGRRLRPDALAHRYEAVIPYQLLSHNPLLVERFVSGMLAPLLEADHSGRRALLETLEAYLGAGSVKNAAAALDVHRHTVIYRLDKVRELAGDIDSPLARHHLQLALELRKLL
jgi:sugar diacid utilization regulator